MMIGQVNSNSTKIRMLGPSWYRLQTFSPERIIAAIIVLNKAAISLRIAKHVKDRATVLMPEECP